MLTKICTFNMALSGSVNEPGQTGDIAAFERVLGFQVEMRMLWLFRDWGQEEKGMTEDEMAGGHHRLDGHGFG